MKGNYNNVASFYDRLSNFIFGNSIVYAQRFLIESILPNSSILIVGGGTGWILEEITARHVEGLQITYVDSSEKMIALSKNRNIGLNKVVFVNSSIQHFDDGKGYDIVITPFVLDNFSTKTIEIVFKKIHERLLPSGLWLWVDFQLSEKHYFWQKPFLKSMYLFFRIVCGIEANNLPDTSKLFKAYQYKKLILQSYFKDFISSAVYKKCKA